MQRSLTIVSRNSRLALAQAESVKQMLSYHYPDMVVNVLGISTSGDKILDKPLYTIGGKGLFTKELEQALLSKEADLAVHSAKDLPSELAPQFSIACALEREDALDVLVANDYNSLQDMPGRAVIGTSSPRRTELLNKYYPHLTVKILRGNIHSRLAKLDAKEYDGLILAAAGLNRLGLQERVKQRLNSKFVPAIGQGIIAVEVLKGNAELAKLLSVLNHADSELMLKTERELGRILQSGCNAPIAAHATLSGDTIYLEAMVLGEGRYCYSKQSAKRLEYTMLAASCASELLAQGAIDILRLDHAK